MTAALTPLGVDGAAALYADRRRDLFRLQPEVLRARPSIYSIRPDRRLGTAVSRTRISTADVVRGALQVRRCSSDTRSGAPAPVRAACWSTDPRNRRRAGWRNRASATSQSAGSRSGRTAAEFQWRRPDKKACASLTFPTRLSGHRPSRMGRPTFRAPRVCFACLQAGRQSVAVCSSVSAWLRVPLQSRSSAPRR